MNWMYIVDRDSTTGAALSTVSCVPCPSGYYPSTDLYSCVACPDVTNMVATYTSGSYVCSCKTTGGLSSASVSLISNAYIEPHSTKTCFSTLDYVWALQV